MQSINQSVDADMKVLTNSSVESKLYNNPSPYSYLVATNDADEADSRSSKKRFTEIKVHISLIPYDNLFLLFEFLLPEEQVYFFTAIRSIPNMEFDAASVFRNNCFLLPKAKPFDKFGRPVTNSSYNSPTEGIEGYPNSIWVRNGDFTTVLTYDSLQHSDLELLLRRPSDASKKGWAVSWYLYCYHSLRQGIVPFDKFAIQELLCLPLRTNLIPIVGVILTCYKNFLLVPVEETKAFAEYKDVYTKVCEVETLFRNFVDDAKGVRFVDKFAKSSHSWFAAAMIVRVGAFDFDLTAEMFSDFVDYLIDNKVGIDIGMIAYLIELLYRVHVDSCKRRNVSNKLRTFILKPRVILDGSGTMQKGFFPRLFTKYPLSKKEFYHYHFRILSQVVVTVMRLEPEPISDDSWLYFNLVSEGYENAAMFYVETFMWKPVTILEQLTRIDSEWAELEKEDLVVDEKATGVVVETSRQKASAIHKFGSEILGLIPVFVPKPTIDYMRLVPPTTVGPPTDMTGYDNIYDRLYSAAMLMIAYDPEKPLPSGYISFDRVSLLSMLLSDFTRMTISLNDFNYASEAIERGMTEVARMYFAKFPPNKSAIREALSSSYHLIVDFLLSVDYKFDLTLLSYCGTATCMNPFIKVMLERKCPVYTVTMTNAIMSNNLELVKMLTPYFYPISTIPSNLEGVIKLHREKTNGIREVPRYMDMERRPMTEDCLWLAIRAKNEQIVCYMLSVGWKLSDKFNLNSVFSAVRYEDYREPSCNKGYEIFAMVFGSIFKHNRDLYNIMKVIKEEVKEKDVRISYYKSLPPPVFARVKGSEALNVWYFRSGSNQELADFLNEAPPYVEYLVKNKFLTITPDHIQQLRNRRSYVMAALCERVLREQSLLPLSSSQEVAATQDGVALGEFKMVVEVDFSVRQRLSTHNRHITRRNAQGNLEIVPARPNPGPVNSGENEPHAVYIRRQLDMRHPYFSYINSFENLIDEKEQLRREQVTPDSEEEDDDDDDDAIVLVGQVARTIYTDFTEEDEEADPNSEIHDILNP